MPSATFCITDEEVMALAKQALIIEQHYGRPMDIEGPGWSGWQLHRSGPSGDRARDRHKGTAPQRFALNKPARC